jgi:hypothetical protein
VSQTDFSPLSKNINDVAELTDLCSYEQTEVACQSQACHHPFSSPIVFDYVSPLWGTTKLSFEGKTPIVWPAHNFEDQQKPQACFIWAAW